MTPDKLREIGNALFGPEWQRAMARALGPLHPDGPRDAIDDSLVRKWARGARPVPDWTHDALARLLEIEAGALRDRIATAQARAATCRRLCEDMRRA